MAILYLLFAVAMLLQKNWAWWLGLIVAAINVLLVLNIVILSEDVSGAGFWLIAPIIIVAYLLFAIRTRGGQASQFVEEWRLG